MPDERAGLDRAVGHVWEKFRDRTFYRLTVLEDAAVAVLEQRLDLGMRRRAEREAHKLAGAVGTFGFAEGSRLARAVELQLQGTGPLSQAEGLELSDLVVALRAEIEAPPNVAASRIDPLDPERPLVLVLTDDEEFAQRFSMEVEGRGLRATVMPLDALGDTNENPSTVLVDLSAADDPESIVARLRDGPAVIPPHRIFLLSERDEFEDRVAITRLGVRALLRKPCPPAAAADAVVDALTQAERGSARILSVDDDPLILEAMRALLEPIGAELRTLSEPSAYWNALEEWNPDLVILDEDMPGATGIDLCRVTRSDPRWRSLPILFFTARTDPQSIERIFAAGADDYVPKPVLGPELVTRIENRLERVRMYRLLAETDGLTGVYTRRKSEETIERLLSLARRQREPLSLAVIDLDEFKRVNDLLGHAAGDDVLRRLSRTLRHGLRGDDVIGRWGGEEFVIGMYGISKASAARRLDEVRARFHAVEAGPNGAPIKLSFSAGVAEHLADAEDLAGLYRAADAALYRAKGLGRDRVVCAGRTAPLPKTIEVALVEDDPILAELLLHTLQTRGYRTAWIQDGESAIERLSGAEPELNPRVVLLDVDLPGQDGMAVLADLHRTGVTGRTRVIMLTIRSTEPDVLRALEAGAADHVAKPFSVPVLLRRIEAAMEAS